MNRAARLRHPAVWGAFLVWLTGVGTLACSLGADPWEGDLRWRQDGHGLDAGEAQALEEGLLAAPDDLPNRGRLIGYYTSQSARSESAAARSEYQAQLRSHLLWFIRNAPESEILSVPAPFLYRSRDEARFEEEKGLWLQHLEAEPENLTLLHNAATYFGWGAERRDPETRALRTELLERGATLDPADHEWPADLGYHLRSGVDPEGPPAEQVEGAERALGSFRRAHELGEAGGFTYFLPLAQMSFVVGDVASARAHAEALLSETAARRFARARDEHHGNLILGRIALAEGDFGEARRRLLVAGNLKDLLAAETVTPNMLLAKELLAVGEPEVVLDYLELCGEFWERGRTSGRLDEWAAAIRDGRIPQFGRYTGW